MPSRTGFTLIELLVVIAIIAVLAVVVVLTLNPAGLLQESRDSNRLSDMATVSSAIGISLADNPSASLGSSSILYVSVPDPAATSTLGDQCQGLGLPALPAGWAYQCAASSTFRKADGTGWVPVNFSQNTFGTSLAQLPLDPANSTSSGLYYTYVTNGQQFEVTSLFESQKYKSQFGLNPIVPGYPEVNAKGSSLSLNPLWSPSGLVGYWPMDEGSGSTTLDLSGNNNQGAWNGSLINGSHYAGGKVGAYAGNFDGSTDYVNVTSTYNTLSSFTASQWVYLNTLDGSGSYQYTFFFNLNGQGLYPRLYMYGNGSIILQLKTGGATQSVTTNLGSVSAGSWNYIVATFNGANNSSALYVNGIALATTTFSAGALDGAPSAKVSWGYDPDLSLHLGGKLDDVRVYNRALSAAEIQALYNAQR